MSKYTDMLKQTTRLADAAPMPEPEFPDVTTAAKKKAGLGNKIDFKSLPASVRGRLEATLGDSNIYQAGVDGPSGYNGRWVKGMDGKQIFVPGKKSGGSSGGMKSSGKWHSMPQATTFWDTGDIGNMGDTGKPASGLPMSANMVSMPFLPHGTIMNIRKNGRTVQAYAGESGPNPRLIYGEGKHLDMAPQLAVALAGQKMNDSNIYRARKGANSTRGYQIQVVSWGTGATYQRNASQARRYRAMYSSLRKTSASQAWRETNKSLPGYAYQWGREHGGR